jgi:hypothetical protein
VSAAGEVDIQVAGLGNSASCHGCAMLSGLPFSPPPYHFLLSYPRHRNKYSTHWARRAPNAFGKIGPNSPAALASQSHAAPSRIAFSIDGWEGIDSGLR